MTMRHWLLVVAMMTPVIALTVEGSLRLRMNANERRIRHVMTNIGQHAKRFHEARFVDADGDGFAEYGWLQQIGGLLLLPDPELPGVMRRVARKVAIDAYARYAIAGEGVISYSGYRIAMFLPDEEGWEIETVLPVVSAAMNGTGRFPLAAPPPDARATGLADKRERSFTLLAWPIDPRESGRHVYMITEEWQLLRIDPASIAELRRDPVVTPDPASVREAPNFNMAPITDLD